MKIALFKVNFEARNFENTMGASTSIQEYSEEVLLAATEGDVAKLMAVLESGDKIVEETEEATKGRFAFSIPFCHYYFEKLRMHLRGSHDWCTVYMRWCWPPPARNTTQIMAFGIDGWPSLPLCPIRICILVTFTLH